MKKKHPIEALIEQGEHQQLDFKFEVITGISQVSVVKKSII